MSMWYVRVRGQQLGPFSTDVLLRWRQQGRVQGFHEASIDRVAWRAIDLIPTLNPAPPEPKPPVVTAKVSVPHASPTARPESHYQTILGTAISVILFGVLALGYLVLKPPSSNRPTVPAGESSEAKPLSGEQVYKRLIKSTVFIVKIDKTRLEVGSGVLVHGPRRLVMTNYHVVGDRGTVMVYFPAYQNGEIVTDPQHYSRNKDHLGFVGTVRAGTERKDLAILELDRLPDGVVPVPLAVNPAGTGSRVYSIGAAGIESDLSGTLWRLSTGEVRARSEQAFRYDTGQMVSAIMLETQKPINLGDSGGPTVNDFGALVGIVAASDRKRDAVKYDIDLTEVRQYLTEFAAKGHFRWDGPTAEGHAP